MPWRFLKKYLKPEQSHNTLLNLGWSQLPLLAVDLELTGLNPKEDKIVSVGWIEGVGSSMALSSAFHTHIQGAQQLKQSPIIHGITASEIAEGVPLQAPLEVLANYAKSHIWVMHCCALDWQMLHKSYMEQQMLSPKPVIVDTLLLERYLLAKSGDTHSPVDLSRARLRHGLPNAHAHNALDDAAATLELLFAQVSRLGLTAQSNIKALKHTGALKAL
ncbi:DNA polymerase III subunit epsilon [Planctobacterium marinum]|uniref:DNA polymerase III subunit epsilon n=1 Tax=Planctobacterium marinum TaxID=1631968 RepID=A0AA48HEZ0_9ALTE|nr:DNA polymerase III subunit epsilon [Planctobacterium marinum]